MSAGNPQLGIVSWQISLNDSLDDSLDGSLVHRESRLIGEQHNEHRAHPGERFGSRLSRGGEKQQKAWWKFFQKKRQKTATRETGLVIDRYSYGFETVVKTGWELIGETTRNREMNVLKPET